MMRLLLDLEQAIRQFIAHEAANALQQIPRGRKMKGEIAIVSQREGHMRIRNGMQQHLLLDVGKLRGLRAQEFPSGGHIEEKRAHLDGGAAGAAVVTHLDELAAIHLHLGADERVFFTRGQAEAAHAGDARHRLAAEAEGVDGGEVVFCADFARGVAFEAKHRVLAVHAAAVIDDFEHRHATTLGVDLDVARTGIEAVFYQFSHDGGGPFHDLPGRHLAGECVGKNADAGHAKGGEGAATLDACPRFAIPPHACIIRP